MKSKYILALLAAAAMATAVTGCGKKDTGNDAAETTAPVGTTAPETTEATTTTTTEVVRAAIDFNAITFDDGSLYTCHCMNGETEGESSCNLEVVDYNGDKKLRVQVLDKDEKTGEYMIPKLVFNLPELLGVENVGKIDHIAVDFDCEAKDVWHNDDGTDSLVVGNFLGTLGGNVAAEERRDDDGKLIQTTWAQCDFECMDWTNPTAYFHVESKPQVIPAKKYASEEGTTLVIMRWAQKNQVDFYIDNLTFYDAEGNSIPVIYQEGAGVGESDDTAAETTVAAEETQAAAEETTTAADTTTAEE